MHKFAITYVDGCDKELDETKPVLYKVWFGNAYYLHKGKKLRESVNRLLEDVFRKMRSHVLQVDQQYVNIVAYCNKNTSLYKVSVELIMNDEAPKILKKEASLYKKMHSDPHTLNRMDIDPYTPEWMLRETLQARCENCLHNGVIAGKKTAFKFCPHCGRLNKKKTS